MFVQTRSCGIVCRSDFFCFCINYKITPIVFGSDNPRIVFRTFVCARINFYDNKIRFGFRSRRGIGKFDTFRIIGIPIRFAVCKGVQLWRAIVNKITRRIVRDYLISTPPLKILAVITICGIGLLRFSQRNIRKSKPERKRQRRYRTRSKSR